MAGGGIAPGDIVSGIRPPFPIESGVFWAATGIEVRDVARRARISGRMMGIWERHVSLAMRGRGI